MTTAGSGKRPLESKISTEERLRAEIARLEKIVQVLMD